MYLGSSQKQEKQLGSKVRTRKRLSVDKQALNRKEGRKEILENTYCEGRTKRGYVVVPSISPRVGMSTVRRKVPKSLRSNP
jgi:hypothetical protein